MRETVLRNRDKTTSFTVELRKAYDIGIGVSRSQKRSVRQKAFENKVYTVYRMELLIDHLICARPIAHLPIEIRGGHENACQKNPTQHATYGKQMNKRIK